MAIIDFPSSLYGTFQNGGYCEIFTNTGFSQSSRSGKIQTTMLAPGDLWRQQVNLFVSGQDWLDLQGFLYDAAGRFNLIRASDLLYDAVEDKTINPIVTLSRSHSRGATTISVNSSDTTDAAIPVGSRIQIGDRLHKVLVWDSSNRVLVVYPPLNKAHNSGAVVTVRGAKGLWRLKSDLNMLGNNSNGDGYNVTLDLIEGFNL